MIDKPSPADRRTVAGSAPTAWFTRKLAPSGREPSLKEQAAAYVRERTGIIGAAATNESRLAGIRKAATTVTKASRAQHHEAVALAYAIFLASREAPDFPDLIAGLAKSAGLRITKATDPLAVIVGSLITYGGGSSDPAASRKLRSRDVQAIRYLVRKNVLPATVKAEAAIKGEGLDTWARGTMRNEEIKRADRQHPDRDRATAPSSYRWTDPDAGIVTIRTSCALSPTARTLIKNAVSIVIRATRPAVRTKPIRKGTT